MAITKIEAKEIARKECEARGWPWREPITVRWGLFSYTVWGGGTKGGNLIIIIRKRDGVLLSADMTPK